MSGVREPAVAGRFYPANAEALRAAVQSYLQSRPTSPRPCPRELSPRMRGTSTRVRLPAWRHGLLRAAGPHRARGSVRTVSFCPRARAWLFPAATAFVTPLGRVPIDTEAVRQALTLAASRGERRGPCPRAQSRGARAVSAGGAGDVQARSVCRGRGDAGAGGRGDGAVVGRAGDVLRRQLGLEPFSRSRHGGPPRCQTRRG